MKLEILENPTTIYSEIKIGNVYKVPQNANLYHSNSILKIIDIVSCRRCLNTHSSSECNKAKIQYKYLSGYDRDSIYVRCPYDFQKDNLVLITKEEI